MSAVCVRDAGPIACKLVLMSSNQFLHLLVVVLYMVPASLLAQDEGCADPLACNFDADVPDSLSTGCEFLSCRDHGDPVHWTYCYGNNADLVFTLDNPSGSDIVLELNNDLPTWSWGAPNGDHLTCLLYTSPSPRD